MPISGTAHSARVGTLGALSPTRRSLVTSLYSPEWTSACFLYRMVKWGAPKRTMILVFLDRTISFRVELRRIRSTEYEKANIDSLLNSHLPNIRPQGHFPVKPEYLAFRIHTRRTAKWQFLWQARIRDIRASILFLTRYITVVAHLTRDENGD